MTDQAEAERVETRGWQVDPVLRQSIVAGYGVESARDDPHLAAIASFVGRLCDVPVSLVTLLDETSQYVLARTGIDADVLPTATSFCQHALVRDELLEVRDATRDPRFADNPFVTGDAHVRFYAGMPLRNAEGLLIGTVCVFDMEPRPAGLTALQREGLTLMAGLTMSRLDDRRAASDRLAADRQAAQAIADSERRFRTLADTMPQMVWSTLPDGYHDYYNARWYEFTGVPEGSTDGEAWNGMFHPDDQARAWATWRHSLATGDPYSIEYRLRHADGTYRWVLGRALPIRDDEGHITRWFGTCTDIHEHKLASEQREMISQELSHRIKNIFAVIAGLVQFAARARPEFREVATDLRQRITALGRAHDFVRPHSLSSRPSAQPDSLHGLLAELFEPYQMDAGSRIVVSGVDIAIDDRAATPLALLFHELATNATKYGALSAEAGLVTVTIDRGDELAAIRWTESGGPPPVAPANVGFGSQLIEMSAVRQLGGALTRDWRPEGLDLTIAVPVAAFSRRRQAG